MTYKSLFRFLIVASWVLIIASLVSGEVLSSQLPALLQQYEKSLNDSSQKIRDDVLFILVLIAFVLFVISNVGLFRFRLWARPLYLVSYAGLMLVILLEGRPSVETAMEDFLGELATLVNGAIIGLSYFRSVKEEFR